IATQAASADRVDASLDHHSRAPCESRPPESDGMTHGARGLVVLVITATPKDNDMVMRLHILVFLLALASALPVSAAELRVGAASEVITPALGTPMEGYFSPRMSQGVDDDLHAKALVIERDGVKVALVVC